VSEFFYFSLILGQFAGWIYFCPETEQMDLLYWNACLYPGQGSSADRRRVEKGRSLKMRTLGSVVFLLLVFGGCNNVRRHKEQVIAIDGWWDDDYANQRLLGSKSKSRLRHGGLYPRAERDGSRIRKGFH